MRKKVFIAGLIVFLCTLTGQATEPKQDVYINAFSDYQISYPADWIIDVSSAKNGYVALFDPRALSTKDTSLELLIGMKIEILTNLEPEDMTNLIAGCSVSPEITFQELRMKQNQYWCYSQETLIIIVPLGKTVLIAYIPEKDKKTTYWQQFNQILFTFKSG